MAPSTCNPCCNPQSLALTTDTYRQSVLQLLCDQLGELTGSADTIVSNQVTLTTSIVETTLLAAGAAGIKRNLRNLLVTNTSATPATISFRDATAGAVKFTVYIPATSTLPINFNPEWVQTTAANNWTVQSSASVTSIIIAVQSIERDT